MLQVRVVRASDGAVLALVAFGHTGFDRKGRDIVCAGASAVLHTAVLGVTRIARAEAAVTAGDGHLELLLAPEARSDGLAWLQAQAVLKAAVAGLREIGARYPGHIELREELEPDPGDGTRAEAGRGRAAIPQRPYGSAR